MNAEEFKKDFLDEVKAAAFSTGEGSSACFAEDMAQYLVDYELLPDFTPCYFEGEYKRKKFRIDGYAFDEFDMTVNLIIADYDGTESDRVITKTSATQAFERALIFVDAILNGHLDIDISLSASDLADILNDNRKKIRKIKLYLFTNGSISSRIKNIENETFEDIPVEAQIWDIDRVYGVCVNPEVETIEIDFRNFNIEGIPCIRANVGNNNKYNSYLGVIPGRVLSDIYAKYGARLLEGNVRSFLSTKVAVNKKIRETILTRPEMFFAFNNGISVTAENVEIEKKDTQSFIVSAKDFQIINGGQTTASLYNAWKNNNADLSSIYVQMKLTEIDTTKATPEETDNLIRDISRSSNSQNKVSDADFFASHPFHRQIEQLSKTTYAPAKNGAQYETIWFYERARGQYLQEQMRLTSAKKKVFLLKNPKNQLIKKTDLAKAQNTWLGNPDVVSKGAQTNFVKYAQYIDEQWQNNSSQFNVAFFESTVAILIMFEFLSKYIPQQEWYEGGYRANIITYSIALFHRLIKRQFPGRDLNLILIWNRQELPDPVKKSLARISLQVFKKITDDDRPVINVTQWCKNAKCWDEVQALKIPLNQDLETCLIGIDDNERIKKSAAKDQKMVKGINDQEEVIKYSADHWKRLAEFAVKNGIVKPSDISALKVAVQLPNKLPNAVQARRLLDLQRKASKEGFLSEKV